MEKVERIPDGTGLSSTTEPCSTVSALRASIPCAVSEVLQLVPRSIVEGWSDLSLGEPQQAWACVIDRLVSEARGNEEIAKKLRGDAADAISQAKIHDARAADYMALASALVNAPVTFADTIEAGEHLRDSDTHPAGGDAKQGSVHG